MSQCDGCDGSGIMLLWSGPRRIKAPCLSCSPDAKLEDLEAEQERQRERDAIREHNQKTGWAK